MNVKLLSYYDIVQDIIQIEIYLYDLVFIQDEFLRLNEVFLTRVDESKIMDKRKNENWKT